VVELFAVGYLHRSPRIVISPVPCVATQKLPTRAHVERSANGGPNPVGGFVARCGEQLTDFET
jgi:hypothetical protein